MKTRFTIFILLASVLFCYVTARLAIGIGWPMWAVQGFLFCGVLIFPATRGWSDTEDGPKRVFRYLIFMDMGYLSFQLALTIMRDVLLWPVIWIKPEWTQQVYGPEGSLSILIICFIILLYGSWSAASGPRVKEVSVPINNLPPALEGFKIAQVSDMHLSPLVGRPFVDRVVTILNGLSPDLVALTGDIGDGHVEPLKNAVDGFKALTPGKPKIFVTGNHEYYWNAGKWIAAFRAAGIQTLLNEHTEIKVGDARILIAGVIDPASRMDDPKAGPDIAKAMSGAAPAAAVKVILVHNPGLAYQAEAAGFDLQLSGHTHAGQFFPWTLVVPRVHEFSNGLKKCKDMWVYVNPGTGSWGPPLRVGSTTEVTLLRLTKA